MAGYSPANSPHLYFPTDWWSNFWQTCDWLRYEAPDEVYWEYWRKVGGWPVPRRSQDSWIDRLKHRDTFLGRIAAILFGN